MVIAAVSARPFVRAAAAAGYEAIAADVFCDADTRRDALRVIQLGYAEGGFDAGAIRRQLFPLLADDVGFVYGSGFETQPQLLEEIAQRCQLIGNVPETVRIVKDPGRFFSLLSALNIPFPETAFSAPAAEDGWISKHAGGSGGIHVRQGVHAAGAGHYYQRQVAGQPFSLLFLADGRQASPVGYNMQLLAPAAEMPYRFGGAVSQAPLPASARLGMLHAAQRITAAVGLRGLNSLDCMVADGSFWVLEVNPRLSATFALYDAPSAGAGLFGAHLRACDGEPAPDLPPEQAQAHLIYYAPSDMAIPAEMQWPPWVADIPVSPCRVGAGEPLCTVTAVADGADEARTLAHIRIAELAQRIT